MLTTAIHGDKSQAARLEALDEFKGAKVQVMVATDVAARGLDIDDLPLVVNYDMPYVPEDYIHRIGRTGRAGLTGEAVSFCAPEEEKLLVEIERLLKRRIPVALPDGFSTEHRRHEPSPHRAPARAVPTPTHHEARAQAAEPRREPRGAREHHHAPASGLTTPSAPRHRGHAKPRPIPALLLKRRVPEPENA